MAYESDYIFGAGGGLGSAISKTLFESGNFNKMILSYRKEEIENRYAHSVEIQHLTNDFENANWVDGSENLFKEKARIFIAHGAYISSGIQDFNFVDAQRIFQINLFSTLQILKIFIENSLPGSVAVVISSIAANNPGPNELIYGASKAALRAAIKSMQHIAVCKGVKIIDIATGAIKTNMTVDREGWEKFIDPMEIAGHLIEISNETQSLRFVNVEILRQRY
jgi:short-subunit dehydrogenase